MTSLNGTRFFGTLSQWNTSLRKHQAILNRVFGLFIYLFQ
jgi:hypothetical protein